MHGRRASSVPPRVTRERQVSGSVECALEVGEAKHRDVQDVHHMLAR